MGNYIYDNPEEQVIDILSELLDVPNRHLTAVDCNIKSDLVIKYKNIEFIVVLKKYSSTIEITNAINRINKFKNSSQDLNNYMKVFLVVVPYMGGVGAELCNKNGVSWIDLSGNAFIKTDKLYVNVKGKENKFKSRGRPPKLFAPKSSRVARYILSHDDINLFQKDIVKKTALSEGYVSRILKRLEEENLIKRLERGYIRISNKKLILNIWLENYDFMKNKIIKGIIPVKSKSEVMNVIIDKAKKQKINYAVTGLSAAWLLNSHVDYKITSIYIEKNIKRYLKNEGFIESERGANLWLIIPQDIGVFQEVEIKNDIKCVHPIQLYLDLMKGHPERAKEAAEMIKSSIEF